MIKKELGNNVDIINIGTSLANTFKEYMQDNSINTSSNEKGSISYVASSNEERFYKMMHKIINN